MKRGIMPSGKINLLIKSLSFIFLLGFSPAIATAATLYVATTGSDASSNLCTQESSPCLTLQAAIDRAAASGDTIRVAAGTYRPPPPRLFFAVTAKSLNIQGEGASRTIFENNTSSTRALTGFSVGHWTAGPPPTVSLADIQITGFGNNGARACHEGIENNGTLTLTRVLVWRNGGTGISNVGHGTLTLDRTTVAENIQSNTSCPGGGIINFGFLKLINSTVVNNQARSGGGISNSGRVHLIHSTITRNIAEDEGSSGGIRNWSSRGDSDSENGLLSTKGSIIAGNFRGSTRGEADDCRSHTSIISWGYNLIGETGNCTGWNSSLDRVGVGRDDLHINFYADNGGPVPTVSLDATSPAVDAIPPAECTDMSIPTALRVTADARGVSRPQGSGCDIGAYEYVAPPGTGSGTTTDSTGGAGSGGAGTGGGGTSGGAAEGGGSSATGGTIQPASTDPGGPSSGSCTLGTHTHSHNYGIWAAWLFIQIVIFRSRYLNHKEH